MVRLLGYHSLFRIWSRDERWGVKAVQELKILLENGIEFHGTGICGESPYIGEIVFFTGMTGYQEVLTDPSYHGQFVVMTYPLIGNYGINDGDSESNKPKVKGLIVKELCETPSHYQSKMSVSDYLLEEEIPFVTEVDTRELTKVIREEGTMRASIAPLDYPKEVLLKELGRGGGRNSVECVTSQDAYTIPGEGEHVLVLDLGLKKGIMKELTSRGVCLTVVPAFTSIEEIHRLSPDKIILSNGPGDPKDSSYVIQLVKRLIPDYPIFGICLGHQIIALACGADTEKMKFGHRGPNHPVKDHRTNLVKITSQNHNYTVRKESIIKTDLEIIQTALHDGTVEGIMHKTYPVMSVQYHPEGSPGPMDSNELFHSFIERDFKKEQEARGKVHVR